MTSNSNVNDWCIVFDLDDTLYKEEDFLLSAYQYIAQRLAPFIGKNCYSEMVEMRANGESVLDLINKMYEFPFSVQKLVEFYRFHFPTLHLENGVRETFTFLKNSGIPIGLLTDGRSISQRNKIKALGLESYFSEILISEEFGSEKPHPENFIYFEKKLQVKNYAYIGDNFKKDFIVPNERNWESIGLMDSGRNIHAQDYELGLTYLPRHMAKSMFDVLNILKNLTK